MKTADKRSKTAVYLFYTIFYVLMAALVWGWFYKSGKSLINSSDAFEQHINALTKYGRYLRGFFYRIFVEHKLSVQNYDLGIGYGADFLTSMQYYAVGDPLNLPVGLLPSKYVYYYFQFLILLRPYLAGLSFLLMTRGNGKYSDVSKLCGAMSYSFCGVVLFIGMWNPQFVQPMICLPLLIYGAQRYIHEKKAAVFILATALSAVSNFYFFYMLVLMIMVYTIIYIFTAGCFESIGKAFRCIAEFLFLGVVGTSLAMPILLPVIIAFLSNPRAGIGSHAIPVIYSAEYYKELLVSLLSYKYFPRYDTVISLTFIALPAVCLLFVKADEDKKKEVIRLRILTALMTVMLLIPAAGYAMTGFSYTINRWSFAYCLLLSYLITAFCEKAEDMKAKDMIVIAAASLIYVAVMFFLGEKSDNVYPQMILLVLLIIPVVIKKIPGNVRKGMLFVLILLGILQNGYAANAPEAGNLPSGYVDKMTPDEYDNLVMSTELKALSETVTEGQDNYYSYSGRNLTWNASLPYSVPSTQFYWSLANGAVSDFMESLAVNEMSNFSFFGLDDRAIPLNIAGVKYYSLRYNNEQEQAYVPIGYAPFSEWYNFGIFANNNSAALGYTRKQVISRKDYDALSPVRRQQAMLFGAVREKENSKSTAELSELDTLDDSYFKEVSVPYEISEKHGLKVKDGLFVVKKENATCTLSFEGIPKSETYLYIENLRCEIPYDSTNISVSTDTPGNRQITKTIAYKTPYSQFYSGWHNYLVNLCYSDEARSAITITFPEKGRYSFDSISVICQSMQDYVGMSENLCAETMKDNNLHRNPMSLMTNEITGTITANEDSYFVINIPYDKGWDIYVDGEKRIPEKANIMFLGTPITEGTHSIALKYHTPGATFGVLMAIAGVAIFIILIITEKKSREDK
ncbi:YfhO family protein [Butyrivibrio sp. AE3004]|uniref:YfhO family protein n=1 Tax=Butyrivibrio sp. AE3004 TaxID=1506994 RepID=UPI000494BB3D|nr:YfhO family protein [Butyrivibrio sp. AE3004]